MISESVLGGLLGILVGCGIVIAFNIYKWRKFVKTGRL